ETGRAGYNTCSVFGGICRRIMRRLKVAIATRCLNRPLKQSLVDASKLGAAGVQLEGRQELRLAELSETGKREFVHCLKELELTLASIDFPMRAGLIDADRLDARIEAIKQTMTLAYNVGCRVLTARLGPLPSEEHESAADLTRNVLNDIARHSNRVGVVVALAPGKEPVDRLRGVLATITEGPIALNFDPASLVTLGQDPLQFLAEMHNWI